MCFDKSLLKIIQHPDLSDNQRRTFILKIVQLSTARDVTFKEALAVFETCLSNAMENVSSTVTVMSLFTFTTWGNKYPTYLKEYLTIERVTRALADDDPNKLTIVLRWLREAFQILITDVDYIALMSPGLTSVLQSKLEDCGRNSMCLSRLAELYISCPSLLPLQNLRTEFTISIMKCVAAFPTPTKPETLKHMKSIGALMNILWETLPLRDLFNTLCSMYSIISQTDPNVEVCPAMAHLLSLVNMEVIKKLGPHIVSDPQSKNLAFVATLTRLSTWLVAWPTAHTTLIHWIRLLVRLLYQHNGRHFVPGKVTYEQVPKLVEALRIPVCRQGVMSVATILLMSFQYSPVVFHMVIPKLIAMIHCLESEISPSAKDTLDELIKLCHGQMALYPGHPESYQPLMDVISKHPAPSDQDIQSLIHEYKWETSTRGASRYLSSSKGLNKLLGSNSGYGLYQKRLSGQKVGLRNLGNTCYMNSVIQALFMTDDFRHSVLHTSPKANQHLLVKLQHLFSLLCFSHRSHIAPRHFHDKSRPTWFNPGMQQDCSEYLRHLMITLHEEERAGQKLPDYQERVIIESETASLASDVQQPLPEDQELDQDFKPMEDNLGEGGASSKELNLNFKNSLDFNLLGDFKRGGSSIFPCMTPAIKEEIDIDSSVGKRKHNISPLTPQVQSVKVSKAESSSQSDNSSDSGISGDLPEEIDFPQSSSQKEASLPHSSLVGLTDDNESSDYFVSHVHKVFGGKILTCIKCLNCKTESIHKDAFTDINLTFQDSDRMNAVSKQPDRLCKQKQEPQPQQEPQQDLKIEDMIATYLTSERLSGENQYDCDRCGCKQDAERSIQILESPEHLILTQLRFYYDTTKKQRQKVFTNVEFNEKLLLPVRHSPEPVDLMDSKDILDSISTLSSRPKLKSMMDDLPSSDISLPDAEYDCYSLYGVVVHSGFSSEGGHYYCYARNSSIASVALGEEEKIGDVDQWYNFNDETVTKTSFTNISRLTKTFSRDTAYLLFYRKVVVPSPHPSPSPSTDDPSSLTLELREILYKDNLQYEAEQEAEFLKKSYPKYGGHNPPKDDDDAPPPSGSCGGGGGMSVTSREIF